VDDVAVFCTFIFAVLKKDNDPNVVIELESTESRMTFSCNQSKVKILDSRE